VVAHLATVDPTVQDQTVQDQTVQDQARRAGLSRSIRELTGAGVSVLGYASLGFGARPPAGLSPRFAALAALGATGIFIDHVPAGPFHLGAVRLAYRLARCAGLGDVVLNPGRPVDPLCRRLEATICTFHGSWEEYRRWDCTGADPGDGHLVYGVPPESRREAHDLMRTRGAGLALICDRAWPQPSAAGVGAGSAGSRTTTCS
jgi:hypothetical protein